jgi:hypothetical protein
MVSKKKLSWIVGTYEIIFIVVSNFLLHVHFQAMRIFLDNLLENVVNLLNLTTICTKAWISIEIRVHIKKVCLQNVNDLTFENDGCLNLILEGIKCFVLGSLFPEQPSFLFPNDLLLFTFNFIFLCFLYPVILSLDGPLMFIKVILDSGFDNVICSCRDGLIFHEEIYNLVHKPWNYLLLYRSMTWFDEDSHS